MITGEVNMDIWAVGTDDGKSTYEIQAKMGRGGKESISDRVVPDYFGRELWSIRCIDYALDKSCE